MPGQLLVQHIQITVGSRFCWFLIEHIQKRSNTTLHCQFITFLGSHGCQWYSIDGTSIVMVFSAKCLEIFGCCRHYALPSVRQTWNILKHPNNQLCSLWAAGQRLKVEGPNLASHGHVYPVGSHLLERNL